MADMSAGLSIPLTGACRFGSSKLSLLAALLISLLAITACDQKSSKDEAYTEADPHWATFETPYEAGAYDVKISLPQGAHLCSIAGSYSSLEWYYVLVDPAQQCEHLTYAASWEELPDFIVIAPYKDVPFMIDTLDDYIAHDAFFCTGKTSATSNGGPHSSSAPTSVDHVGNIIAGLDTVKCTRTDVESDRYSSALLAYQPNPNDMGHGYTVGAYVHTKNAQAADQLVEQIAKRLEPLNPNRGEQTR